MKKLVNCVVEKKNVFQKKNGDAFIESACCIFILLVCFIGLTFTYSIWMAQFNTNDSINLIHTSYLKKMETYGYLTLTDQNNLTVELREIGMENISLVGTTTTMQEYGQPIQLVIEGDIDMANENNPSFNRIASIVESVKDVFNTPNLGKFRYSHKMAGTSKY